MSELENIRNSLRELKEKSVRDWYREYSKNHLTASDLRCFARALEHDREKNNTPLRDRVITVERVKHASNEVVRRLPKDNTKGSKTRSVSERVRRAKKQPVLDKSKVVGLQRLQSRLSNLVLGGGFTGVDTDGTDVERG